jgi:hypothetical protein
VLGISEDLPTPPYGHPSLEKVLYLGKPQERTFRSEEGIFPLITHSLLLTPYSLLLTPITSPPLNKA